jgi:hypothetical protein
VVSAKSFSRRAWNLQRRYAAVFSGRVLGEPPPVNLPCRHQRERRTVRQRTWPSHADSRSSGFRVFTYDLPAGHIVAMAHNVELLSNATATRLILVAVTGCLDRSIGMLSQPRPAGAWVVGRPRTSGRAPILELQGRASAIRARRCARWRTTRATSCTLPSGGAGGRALRRRRPAVLSASRHGRCEPEETQEPLAWRLEVIDSEE